MMNFFKYVFFKAYYFCIKYLKEKEFPWMFTSVILAMLLSFTLLIILGVLKQFFLIKFSFSKNVFGLFSLLILLVVAIKVKYKNYYLKIVKDVNKFSLTYRKKMKILFLIYIVIVIVILILLRSFGN